jgi:excisionase family DNA binding protein
MNALDARYPVKPSDSDRQRARRALEALLKVRSGANGTLVFRARETDEAVELPAVALDLLKQMLEDLAAGHAVTVIPAHAELTTQQAADMLNVSRPHLIKMLERGDIPCHMAGTHRRIRFDDLRAFMERRDRQRRKALDELARQGQELKQGY